MCCVIVSPIIASRGLKCQWEGGQACSSLRLRWDRERRSAGGFGQVTGWDHGSEGELKAGWRRSYEV